jgi:hypothetical protein
MLVPLILGTAAVAVAAQAGDRLFWSHDDDEEELEFEEAHLYLELNDTDGDLGIHGLIDGDAWKSLEIEGPDERSLMNVWIRGALRRQGMTEFFFESAEPSFDELDPKKFFRRVPEGTYEIEGRTLEGDELEGEVELSHTLAGRPPNLAINGEAVAENCDVELPVLSAPFTLSWDPVTMSHPTLGNTGVPVTVVQYEVVGEIEREGETPEVLVFSAILPADVTSFEFPEDFTDLAEEEIKFEIVTKLDNDNQSAVESCFEIEED